MQFCHPTVCLERRLPRQYIEQMRPHSLSAVLFAAFLVACDREIAYIDGEAATVIVYGRVSVPDGGSPPRALISLSAHVQGSCANPALDAVNAVTTEAGEYRAAFFNWGTQFTVCVSVNAAPAEGSGYLATSAQLAPVVMRSDKVDSVRVDVELQPTP